MMEVAGKLRRTGEATLLRYLSFWVLILRAQIRVRVRDIRSVCQWVRAACSGVDVCLSLCLSVRPALSISNTAYEGDTSCLCFELWAVTDSLAIRVATVPVSVPFSVQSKICYNFKVLRFLKVLNNPKFCYVIGQIPGTCDHCSILSYLTILAYKCIKSIL